jgi:hypothetical protein
MNDDQKRHAYEGWAIVQQMGHVTIAGYVTETQLAGFGVLSVAIPDGDRTIQQLIPASTLYSLTWVGENEARLAARRHPVEPISEWDIRTELRERIEREERESIEQRALRAAEHKQRDAATEERRRIVDILSDTRRFASRVTLEAGSETRTADLQDAANALIDTIDAHLTTHPQPARQSFGSSYTSADDEDELKDLPL